MVGTFVLQWHLSENCNLKCLHCYQEDHKPMCISYNKLEHIYNEFVSTKEKECDTFRTYVTPLEVEMYLNMR